ncbi:MAG: PEGA domain-containing protein [Byssovorax sp.]
MHLRRWKLFGSALLLCTVIGRAALGSDTPANDPGKLAEKHYALGKEQMKAGNLREAYTEYKAAFALKQSYDIAANLGNVELELGMPRDAAEHLSFALKSAAVGVSQDRLDKLKARLGEAKNLVGTAKVQTNLDGAEVFIDGRSVGRSPITDELYVDPGPCVVEARLAGHDTAREQVDFKRATTRNVLLTLKLTGSAVGVPTAPPTASGTAPPPPPHAKSKIPIFVGVAGGLAGLGMGVAGFALANAKDGEIDTLKNTLDALDTQKNHSVCGKSPAPTACGALDDAYRAKGSLTNLGITGFVITGVAAAGTLGYLFLYPSPQAEGRNEVRASVNVGPGTATVGLSGRF